MGKQRFGIIVIRDGRISLGIHSGVSQTAIGETFEICGEMPARRYTGRDSRESPLNSLQEDSGPLCIRRGNKTRVI